jgi:hypothetical protein
VYIGGFAVLALLGWPKLIDQGTVSLFAARITIGCLAVLSLVVLFAMLGQGITQGLVGLDSSVAITPSPIGKTEFVTVSWIRKDRIRQLRHSEIYAAQETIDAVIEWLESSGACV